MSREGLVFFVDRCLGSTVVPSALRVAGAHVEIHADHFVPDATDTEILAFVGARGWIFLSKDKMIRRRAAEMHALKSARVAAFIATGDNAKGDVLGQAFATALRRMEKVCADYERPVVAAVGIQGDVRLIEGQRRAAVKRGK